MSLSSLKKRLDGAGGSDEAARRPVVVIVDDDIHVLRALKVVLNRQYDVHTADGPIEGLRTVLRLQPDVVVLDIRMPEHDGFWVFREIRKHNTDVPIIFNSAYQDAMAEEDAAASYRPFAYITKGDSAQVFLDKLAEAVAWHHSRRGQAADRAGAPTAK